MDRRSLYEVPRGKFPWNPVEFSLQMPFILPTRHRAEPRGEGGLSPGPVITRGCPECSQRESSWLAEAPAQGGLCRSCCGPREFQGSHSGLLFIGHKGWALVTGIFHPGPSSSWFPRLLELVGQHQFLEQTISVINSRAVEPRGCFLRPRPKQVFLRSFCGLIGGGPGERFSRVCLLLFHKIQDALNPLPTFPTLVRLFPVCQWVMNVDRRREFPEPGAV